MPRDLFQEIGKQPKDLFEMAGISTLPEEPKESLLKSTAKGFAKGGATFMPKAFWGGVKVLKDVANQYPAFTPWAAGTQLIPEGYPEKQIAEVEKTAEYLTPEERKGWTQYIPKAAETLGQMAGSAISTAGVGTLPAMATGAGIDRTLRTQKEGESLPKSLLAGGMSGTAEYVTELTPLKYLSKIGLPYLKRLAGGLISDVPGEIYETFIEMKSIDEGLLGKKYTPQEYAKAILDTAATSAMTTGIATTAVQPFKEMPPKRPFIPEAEEVVLPPGEKPFVPSAQEPIKQPKGFTPLVQPESPITRPPRDLLAENKEIVQPTKTKGKEVYTIKPGDFEKVFGGIEQPLPKPENIEIVKPQMKEFMPNRNIIKTYEGTIDFQSGGIRPDSDSITITTDIPLSERDIEAIQARFLNRSPQEISPYGKQEPIFEMGISSRRNNDSTHDYSFKIHSRFQQNIKDTPKVLEIVKDMLDIKPQPKGFTPTEAPPVVSKEPVNKSWQMNKIEARDFLTSANMDLHRRAIKEALDVGLTPYKGWEKDYPELQKQTHTMPSGEVMLGAEHATGIASPAIQDELLHNNEPVTKVEAKGIIAQSQQDYSPRAIKQHKAYLFEQIDEAIKDAKDYEVEPVSISTYESISQKEAETTNKLKAAGASVGFVTIEVPGDGKFRIINSKQALSKFKNDVVAKFPTTKFSNVQKIEKAPMGVVADKAKGIEQIMEGTYKNQPIHGNGNMLLFTPLKIKPKSYRTGPNGDRVSMPPRIDELIDKKTPHYNVDDIVFFVQKADEVEATSDIPLPYLKEDMAIAELYAGDKHTFISQDYYNYIKAHFPDATFKIADIDKAVQIYSNKKLVGLVMPLELPSHAPTKAKGEIVKEPTTNLETFGFQSMYEAGEKLVKNTSEYVKAQQEYKKILKEGGVTEDIPHDIGKFKQFISFPHTVAKRFPKTKVFQERTYQQVEQFENLIGDLKYRLDPYIKNHDNKVDQALIDGYVTPTPKLFSDQELSARGLSQEEIQAYRAVSPTMKAAAKVLEQHLLKVGKDPQEVQAWMADFQESYIPLSRFGKFYVSVKDAQGNGVTTPTFDTVGQARKAVVDLRRQYPNSKITMGNVKRLAPEAYEGMPLNVLAFLSQFDENLSANFASVIGKGFPGHLLQVKKTPGFETNLKKSISDYVMSLARYVSINEYQRDITNMLNNKNIVDPKREAGLWGYWKRHSDYIISNPKEFAKFRQFFYYYYLGANIKSALLNSTQPLTTTYPVLSKYAKQPAMLMAKAFKLAAHTQKGLMKINPELAYAVQSAIHDGTISEQNINELRGLQQGKSASKIGNALSFLFSSAEKFNRKVSFIAIYTAAREGYLKKGQQRSHAEMQKMAEDFVKETQYDYRKLDRPELARGWRAPMFTFRMFSGNYLSMLKNLMVEKEFAALARSLGVMLILGGVSAIPGWKELEKALELMGYDPKKSFREYMGKEQGEIALHGLPFKTGGNISGALGTIELLPGDIQQGVTAGLANLVLGVPTDIPKRFDRARQYLFKLNSPYRAVEAVMPEFVRNPMVAIRWIREEGIRSPKFEKLGTATNKDIFFKAIGIQPSNLTNIYERKHSAIVIKNRLTKNTEEYNFRLARALYGNDIEEYKKTLDEIIRHNQKSKSELDLIIPDKSSIKRQVQGMYDSGIKDVKGMPKRGRKALMELEEVY